jgi:signal transduction histidine kinase
MLLTNALMVTISLFMLLFIGGLVIRSFSTRFIKFDQNILNQDAFTVDDILNKLDPKALDWEDLDNKLAVYNYELCVIQNGKLTYSSIEESQKRIFNFLKNVKWNNGKVNALNAEGITIIGKNVDEYTVVALYIPDSKELGRNKLNSEIVLITFLLIGLTTIIIILFISQLFSHHIVKKMMIPVNALTEGAKRVEQGDLSGPILYKGNDEFRVVCDAFNDMQLHIKEEKEKNLLYEKTRTDLVSGISHDLRTPLTSIKGYIKGLQDGVAFTPKKQEQYLSIAYKKACDMEVLLQRLNFFSHMESGKLPLVLKKIDIREFVIRYVNEISEELKQRGIQIIVECIPLSHFVMMDEEQIIRVLSNLMENAISYSNKKDLVLKLFIWRERETVHLVFADNGNGVTKEQLPHLFEQFWRGDESRSSRNGNGSGLGLYIVKYIIEAHGGSVLAENENGLKIEILLPRGKVDLDE